MSKWKQFFILQINLYYVKNYFEMKTNESIAEAIHAPYRFVEIVQNNALLFRIPNLNIKKIEFKN